MRAQNMCPIFHFYVQQQQYPDFLWPMIFVVMTKVYVKDIPNGTLIVVMITDLQPFGHAFRSIAGCAEPHTRHVH